MFYMSLWQRENKFFEKLYYGLLCLYFKVLFEVDRLKVLNQ